MQECLTYAISITAALYTGLQALLSCSNQNRTLSYQGTTPAQYNYETTQLPSSISTMGCFQPSLHQLEKGWFRFKYINYHQTLKHFHPSHVPVAVASTGGLISCHPGRRSSGSMTKWGYGSWMKLPRSCFPTVSCLCHQITLQQLSYRLSINPGPKAYSSISVGSGQSISAIQWLF